jgi:hypothetical protein
MSPLLPLLLLLMLLLVVAVVEGKLAAFALDAVRS